MIAAIQQSTRRYAKRQMTWFRRVEGALWLDEPDVAAALAWLRGSVGILPGNDSRDPS